MKNTPKLRRAVGLAALAALVGFFGTSCESAAAVVYHTVSFHTGAGGSEVPPVRVRNGHTVARPAADPSRAGYDFVDWYSGAYSGNPFDFAAARITADATVFARWAAASVGGDCEYPGCGCVDCEGADCACGDGGYGTDCGHADCGCVDCEGDGCACESPAAGCGHADCGCVDCEDDGCGCESPAAGCGHADCGCADCEGAACRCETYVAGCGYDDCECVDCEGASCDCDERQGRAMTVEIAYGITMTMNRIARGVFTMGQNDGLPAWSPAPERQVTLTRGFYMGIHAVTQEQFYAVMGHNPSDLQSGPADGDAQERRPVENVNWYHAIAFANRLSIMQGLEPVYYVSGVDWETLAFADVPTTDNAAWNAAAANREAGGFRLPTEAEWEFSARAGTTTQWSFGDTDADIDYYAWSGVCCCFGMTREAGRLRPNPWGLYDMHGNVWEWVYDVWGVHPGDETDPTGALSGAGRVIRGGSWNDPSEFVRSAIRIYGQTGYRSHLLGFRVVRP